MALKNFMDLKSININAQEQGKFGSRGQSPRLDINQELYNKDDKMDAL